MTDQPDRAPDQTSDQSPDQPDEAPDPAPEQPAGAGPRFPTRFVLIVIAAYAVVGVAAGWLWFTLWGPADGVVAAHQWYAQGDALRGAFSGTALYVLIAAGAGLLLGLGAALIGGRQPMLTLVVAVAGSVLAAWLMLTVGQALSPEDPAVLAKQADDQTILPSTLSVSGLGPTLAFPMGTLAALAFVFTIFAGKSAEAPTTEEPRG